MRLFHLLIGLVVFLVINHSAQAQKKKTRVGFVTNNSALFWSYVEAGCRKAEKEFNVEVLYREPLMGTATEQKRIIDQLLAKKIGALAVSVINPRGQSAYLKRIGKKTPFITMDNDAPQSGRRCYVGTDNYQAGREVGKLIKNSLPNGGTVALFVGSMGPINAKKRAQGIFDELAGKKNAKGNVFGKYKLYRSGAPHGVFIDQVRLDKAKTNADFVLTQMPNKMDLCLVGLWAYNPPAIYAAVKAAKRAGHVKVVGFDEDDITLAGIEKGHIHGTIVQQPFLFGYHSVRIMASLAKGKPSAAPKSGFVYIPTQTITQTNVKSFRRQLKKLSGR